MFFTQDNRKAFLRAFGIAAAMAVCAAPALASRHRHHTNPTVKHTYSWEHDGIDLSPVDVETVTFTPPAKSASTGAAVTPISYARLPSPGFVRKMHLENGAKARGTHYITSADIRSRDLFVLQITQSLEGGFDSVNMYDRGILSWGLMQWTAWTGSLPRALGYMKTRLAESHRQRVWQKTFVANGLDVQGGRLVVYGKPLVNEEDMRLAFRGTVKPGEYDPKLVNHWVTTMARAGRQSDIAQLEIEYAAHVVDGVLLTRLDLPYHAPGRDGLTPADLAGNDPYAEALIFALWTNNPRHAMEYVTAAARAARSVSISDDPSLWAPGAFSSALLRKCRTSRFGNWQARASMIEARADQVHIAPASTLCPFEQQYQQILAVRKERRYMELASRHESIVRARLAKAAARRPARVEVARAAPSHPLTPAPAVTKPITPVVDKPLPLSFSPVTPTIPSPAQPPLGNVDAPTR